MLCLGKAGDKPLNLGHHAAKQQFTVIWKQSFFFKENRKEEKGPQGRTADTVTQTDAETGRVAVTGASGSTVLQWPSVWQAVGSTQPSLPLPHTDAQRLMGPLGLMFFSMHSNC